MSTATAIGPYSLATVHRTVVDGQIACPVNKYLNALFGQKNFFSYFCSEFHGASNGVLRVQFDAYNLKLLNVL